MFQGCEQTGIFGEDVPTKDAMGIANSRFAGSEKTETGIHTEKCITKQDALTRIFTTTLTILKNGIIEQDGDQMQARTVLPHLSIGATNKEKNIGEIICFYETLS